MLPSQDRPHDTRSRTIPANIRRRYGYPAPYRSDGDSILERLDELERAFQILHQDPDWLEMAMRMAEVG